MVVTTIFSNSIVYFFKKKIFSFKDKRYILFNYFDTEFILTSALAKTFLNKNINWLLCKKPGNCTLCGNRYIYGISKKCCYSFQRTLECTHS